MERKFMKLAIKQALKAEKLDEVPIGAVIVKDGKVIARAHNKKESKNQATRHAEIEVIEKATKKVNNWWLEDCDIYVTLEPCAMCAGALINSRLRNIYFGAYDKKAGCCQTTKIAKNKPKARVLPVLFCLCFFVDMPVD